MLRALRLVNRSGLHLEAVLDISDGRTLKKLIERAGVAETALGSLTDDEFLLRQQFVHHACDGLVVLRSLL